MVDRISDVWGTRTPHAAGEPWPVRVDEHVLAGVDDAAVTWRQSACVLCSHGCGVDVAVAEGRIVGVRGRADDRVSHGRLGPKGLYGWQANNSPDRLTTPLVRRDGQLVAATWDDAMELVVRRSRDLLTEEGPQSLGFYTSGQLFLEDYYTLTVLARAGLGTPHLDGNTRLCTATAAFALKETFGTDGDPGSLDDFDVCDALFAVGHNMAETHTVLWMRVLDRLEGADPPSLLVVDPRPTELARRATVHLPVMPGTNLALLNAIQHQLLAKGWVDHSFLEAHTIGLERLERVVAEYPPDVAAEICRVSAADIEAAAEVIGSCERLVSTCLQGVYQSHQATASALQVNNINLLRGMIGKPGCAVFQMNGQPTAQNTRETGADGDLTGLRNWQNPRHVAELAALWNVDQLQIPHWGPPTHAMQIFRLAESGAIRFLWIIGTNPAVSMPELHRIREILDQERLFVVVSDAFMSETAALADVVLPAALWGEKTGTFTNHDRTVHLSEQAVPPPGEARADMEIFLDYARRLDLLDRDGQPLIPWASPEECFEAFKLATRGRPCDYTGLTYAKLRGSPGIQWPCNDEHPDGTPRLYTDHRFNTDTDYCEGYGHDLVTGAGFEEKDHIGFRAQGRAMLRAAHWSPPHELPDDDYPWALTTGRTVYQFHTRTKTGRAPELHTAAPTPWVEVSRADADRLGASEGSMLRLESRRGTLELPVRVTDIRERLLFVPFHYGYWDTDQGADADGHRAANELTMTGWDPVSKQPIYKVLAVRARHIEHGAGSPA